MNDNTHQPHHTNPGYQPEEGPPVNRNYQPDEGVAANPNYQPHDQEREHDSGKAVDGTVADESLTAGEPEERA